MASIGRTAGDRGAPTPNRHTILRAPWRVCKIAGCRQPCIYALPLAPLAAADDIGSIASGCQGWPSEQVSFAGATTYATRCRSMSRWVPALPANPVDCSFNTSVASRTVHATSGDPGRPRSSSPRPAILLYLLSSSSYAGRTRYS